MFGRYISLNFKDKGDKYKTLLGGIFSIFIILVIIAYGMFRAYILITEG